MDMKQQNWNNLCSNHVRDWHGIWTRYSPQREVTESFQSLRSFRSNPDQTEITQTNRYMYADGTVEEKTWQYNQQSNNLADGFFHPISPSMRTFFFEQGAAAWAGKQFEPGSFFQVELFFRHEDLRHSVPVIYEGSGSLKRTVSIREDAGGFPSKYWSTELNLLPERNLSGSWQGTSVTMTPDLKVLPLEPTQFHWGWEGNKTFFFPDGISLSCPSQVSIGTNFTIAANWLVTSCQLQQLIIKYNEFGAFSTLTFEQFRLQDAGGYS